MKATTLKPLTINIGSDVRNPSGYQPLTIPAGELIWITDPATLTCNVWIQWGVYRGKIECGTAQRLIDGGQIERRAQ